MTKVKIPKATAKRLPLYYRLLQHLSESGKSRISSSELSELVKVDSATIRRDLSYFGALGKKGYGYDVEYLISFLRTTLSQDELTKVMLVGVGNLGTALLRYNFLKNNNTKVVKAFDVDADKVGNRIAGTPVYHLDNLEKHNIDDIPVAILTVPAGVAQGIVDRLVSAGISGILNFTPVRLSVPKHVRIHHIDLGVELQALVYFLNHYPKEKVQGGD